MVGSYRLPKYDDFELGYGLEFCEPTPRKDDKVQLRIKKKILNAKRVIIKNMLAIKLAKVNFKNNFGKMQEYNELLKEYGCIFYFVSFGIMNINRFTEFDGNILVIKKTGIGTGYHMIPLRKLLIFYK